MVHKTELVIATAISTSIQLDFIIYCIKVALKCGSETRVFVRSDSGRLAPKMKTSASFTEHCRTGSRKWISKVFTENVKTTPL
jgi:hypothetical protein